MALALLVAPWGALPSTATHWSGSGSLAPLRAFSNEVVSFTFTLNNSAPEPLRVFAVRMVACWHGGGSSSDIKPDDGTAVNISASGSFAFTGDIAVPPLSDGLCHTAIVVRGQAASDAAPGYGDYHYDVNYSTRPPLGLEVLGGPLDGEPPLNATFNASASGGAPPYQYAWDFGDGAAASGATVNHSFTTVGRFNASVVATDVFGQRKAAGVEVWVHSGLAVEASARPTAGDAPLSVTFDAATVGAFGALSFNWTFGDGAAASGKTVTHIYAAPGAYVASLEVEDGAHAHSNSTLDVTAWAPVTVSVVIVRAEGGAPMSYRFSASAAGPSGHLSYHWQFGDGTDGFGQNATHIYAAAGAYNVTVHVTDQSTGRVFEGHSTAVAAPIAPNYFPFALIAAVAIGGTAALFFLNRRSAGRRLP